jgi:hypothetical protein
MAVVLQQKLSRKIAVRTEFLELKNWQTIERIYEIELLRTMLRI